ncbi:MAG: peptide MFS transporter [Pseudomonadota bacterium]
MKTPHPKGLYLLFSVEMWERFSFYGMLALLVLFMKKFLGWSTETAGSIYGWYIGLVFLTPIFGGYLADRFFGPNKCIIAGAITIAAGQFVLFSVPYTHYIPFFYLGIALIIAGNGLFKSNISVLVGNLYHKDDPRKDAGFTIFYMGINLGAAIAPIICGFLGEKVAWQWGFFAAGVGMIIGLFTFILGKKKYLGNLGEHPASPKAKHSSAQHTSNEPITKTEKQRMAVIFIMSFFVIFFWFAFKQNGGSLTLFASESTERFIPALNWEIPASWFVSLNAVFILLLAPLFSSLWVKLAAKHKEPSTPAKFVWGLMLLAFGFVIMALAAYVNYKVGKVGILWLTGAYLFLTLGELCLSPVGLSLVTKLSPARFASMLMGAWFLANFVANKLAGQFSGLYDQINHIKFYMIPVGTAVGAAILLLLLKKYIKRWMHGIH